MTDPKDKYGQPWTRDELTLALYYYCQIPFAKTKATNPEVCRFAGIIGRTPAALARKLGNIGACDPSLALQGISGLSHVSRADRQVWTEYSQDWNRLVDVAESLLASLDHVEQRLTDYREPSGQSETTANVKIRRHQAFFRRCVVANYSEQCAVCRLDIAPLLVASHIVPWAYDEKLRTNPYNGICLCSIHDKAFDTGMLQIDNDYNIILSPRLQEFRSPMVKTYFTAFEGQPLYRPDRFLPDPRYLRWHREHVGG